MKIRTRFAPSPTGHLHIGSARTALYSWLFTRNMNGIFILRIDDTDQQRSNIQTINTIIESMHWLQLNWDEGPYFQSKRLDRYRFVIHDMLSKGIAYKCYCSKERLQKLRETQILQKEKPKYDNFCRENTIHYNKPYVVRFKNPKYGLTIFHDLIHGPIAFNNQELDDLIICRTDGSPTYNFCVVVDDLDMKITHVIRGEDHISNTPRQINMLHALNAPIPYYAHVSMILGNDGKKLSKRHGAIGVTQYRDDGFLPEALLNYLVRLGWSHGDKEIFSLKEMKRLFNLNSINKSASIFKIQKLLWLNHYYINFLPAEYIVTHLIKHMNEQNINFQNGPKLIDIIKLLGKRYKTLKEIAIHCRYFYEDIKLSQIDIVKKYLNSSILAMLQIIRDKLNLLIEWNPTTILEIIQNTANSLQLNIHQISMPLRIIITGSCQSPEINIVIYILGKSKFLYRIDTAINYLLDKKL